MPSIPGAADANHDSGVTVTKEVYSVSNVPLVRLDEGYGSNYAQVQFTVGSDLGSEGSVSLVAETQNFPSTVLQGGAWPVLVYFTVAATV